MEEEETVVIVGGGKGVTAVVAAEIVTTGGEVIVFEGSKHHVDVVRKTARLNSVEDIVSVRHAIVGEETNLRGAPRDAEFVSSEQLPACDILELDCEGAELGIVSKMSINPRAIVVETHGHLDSPTGEVEDTLKQRGYSVVSKRTVVPENDVCVIVATDREKQ